VRTATSSGVGVLVTYTATGLAHDSCNTRSFTMPFYTVFHTRLRATAPNVATVTIWLTAVGA